MIRGSALVLKAFKRTLGMPMIYIHNLNRWPTGLRSPVDGL
jgi:hypothetical protein